PFKVALSFNFYSMAKGNFAHSSASNNELERLINLDFRSGTIYFSGANFSNVISFFINPENLPDAKKYFDRCGPGSIITFDNVTFKDEQNSIKKINTTLRLE